MEMIIKERYQKLIDDDKNMKIGSKVIVRWGYGLGFRAQGRGVIIKIYPKSVQVKLIEPVNEPCGGWPKSHEIKGIPRYSNIINNNWDYWNMVELIQS